MKRYGLTALAAGAWLLMLGWSGGGIAQGSQGTVFERTVLRGSLSADEKGYYAAVWTSLGFFQGADSARQTLAPFDAVKQRRQADSAIQVLFLPLDSDPITPGNAFLLGLAEKLEYCRGRGFIHRGATTLTDYFDDAGLLVLVNGVPTTTTALSLRTIAISWGGEDYYASQDLMGRWRLASTETIQSKVQIVCKRGICGPSDPGLIPSLTLREFTRHLTGGVAVFDPDEPLNEHSAIVQPVSVLDSTDWRSRWSVINLGLRAKDFVRDSSGWRCVRARGALTIASSGSERATTLDSVSLDIDLGRQKPGKDDLVVLQKVEKLGLIDGDRGMIHGCVLGVDIANSKDHHWKKSIPFPVGWSNDSVTLGYGWLLNPEAVNVGCIGGRPPLIHDVVAKGDSLLLFFQLVGAASDPEGHFRTHVRLRFIKEEERKKEVILGKLYRLGTEPLASPGTLEVLPAATQLGMVETSSASSNVTFGTHVPVVHEGFYKIVVECHRTTGTDPRPFEMIIFDNIRIKESKIQAAK